MKAVISDSSLYEVQLREFGHTYLVFAKNADYARMLAETYHRERRAVLEGIDCTSIKLLHEKIVAMDDG